MRKVYISVVIPVYRAGDCLVELCSRLKSSIEEITEDYEIIMVEDGSTDKSWSIIKSLGEQDEKIKGIKFSRNFGQHTAITAGLDYATGDWIVIMDSDLQDRPEEIEKLYEKAMQGYDVILARRCGRKDGLLKRSLSKAFYKVFDYFTDTKTDPTVGTFRILSKRVVESFTGMREQYRFFGGMIQWLGFRTAFVDISHCERASGKSTYNFKKLLNLALGAIVSFSDKPLRLSIKLGFTMSIGSILSAIYLIYRKLAYGIIIEGWTSIIVSLYFLGGLLFLNLGVLGLYIGRVFDEAKRRPLYVIEEVTSVERDRLWLSRRR